MGIGVIAGLAEEKVLSAVLIEANKFIGMIMSGALLLIYLLMHLVNIIYDICIKKLSGVRFM